MTSKLNKQIGNRIRELRKLKGYSQEQLAEALDIATKSVSYIETGNGFMTLATLEKMCKVLDVEPYEIFQFKKIETKEEIYTYIQKKLDLIKDNEEKLKELYLYIKKIL